MAVSGMLTDGGEKDLSSRSVLIAAVLRDRYGCRERRPGPSPPVREQVGLLFLGGQNMRD